MLHALHERGNRVALPVTPRRGEPLDFPAWRPGDILVPERFGTVRPIGEILVPDMLLIPLLAFDMTAGGWAMAAASTTARSPVCRTASAWAAPSRHNRWTPCPLALTTSLDAVATRTASSAVGVKLRILFLGDVLGRTGRDTVAARLPGLREDLRIDLAVVNAENASHGFGLAPDMARTLFAAGADVITLGNHAWDRKEIIPYIAETPRLIRPLNFPPGTPGNGSILVALQDGRKVLVLQAMGRLFMDPLDCPFRGTARTILARYRLGASVQAIVADFHAEASSEKMAYAHTFDGQVSSVVGTHTHCPSADAQILPGGTAFQSDAGMCGDYDSVIGMVKDGATCASGARCPAKAGPGRRRGHGLRRLRRTDDTTGLARRIEPVRIGGRLAQVVPTT